MNNHLQRGRDRRALLLASKRAHNAASVAPPVLAAVRAGRPREAAAILQAHTAQLVTKQIRTPSTR
jgi:hypothetical protein